MACPGSVRMLRALKMPEADEPDFRVDGTTAHAGAARCLENDQDAWEMVGEVFDGHVFTDEMAVAVQVYLDECRKYMTSSSHTWIEYRFFEPLVHPEFFGTVDFAALDGDVLTIIDYKHGAGIPVDVEGNPQTRYYAYGMMLHPDADKVATVSRVIVQPRVPWHPDGTIRRETEPAQDIRDWARDVLVPAMLATEKDASLDPGKHCRFCPAKLVCPALTAAYRSVAVSNAKAVANRSDAGLDLDYGVLSAVKFYIKALETEVLTRALRGGHFESAKLVQQRADRVWKPGAEERMKEEFGDKIYSEPVFLTPARVEKLGASAQALVREWAYTPDRGFTLAPRTDKRAEVTVQPGSEVFSKALADLEKDK
jgi:hypothetical protein